MPKNTSSENRPTPSTSPEQCMHADKQMRKRSRRQVDDEEDTSSLEDFTRLKRRRRSLRAKTSDGLARHWSCPFWKLDRIRHMDCMSYKLTRIQDVKQHLIRKHFQSPFYCPTCHRNFQTAQERDHHIRQRECDENSTWNEEPPTASISPEKQDKLRARVSGSDEMIWYRMWHILFDGTPPPASPYQTTFIEEGANFMLEFWAKHQSEILLDISRPDQAQAPLPSLISSALSRLTWKLKGLIHDTKSSEPCSSTSDSSGVSTSRSSTEPTEVSLVTDSPPPDPLDNTSQDPEPYSPSNFILVGDPPLYWDSDENFMDITEQAGSFFS